MSSPWFQGCGEQGIELGKGHSALPHPLPEAQSRKEPLLQAPPAPRSLQALPTLSGSLGGRTEKLPSVCQVWYLTASAPG